MTCILYNPLAGGGKGKEKAQELQKKIQPEKTRMLDITQANLSELLQSLPASETVILAGGDGTINRFVNRVDGAVPKRPIYYYPAGSGNDFMNDVGAQGERGMVLLNRYLENLPVVEVNGTRHFFVNGVGYGIDGYCCQVGDQMRAQGKQKINYTRIAIKGLLGGFHTASAVVTVDGVQRRYRHVWLAPTMNGRYYGGGMNIAPDQDRLNEDGSVSAVVLHCASKLKTLIVFPGIFKGTHVRHGDMVSIFSGHEIFVQFDRPAALQIDGETIPDVREYRVFASEAKAGRAAG